MFKVDIQNDATKTDLKNVTHVDTSLKTEVDKLDIGKLVQVSVDLSKLSEIKNAVKKAVYDKLVAKVNNIDSNTFVLKTK